MNSEPNMREWGKIMTVEPLKSSRKRFALFLELFAGVALSGCIPQPGSGTYFQHSLKIDLDGRESILEHNYKCSSSYDFSEGDDLLHDRNHQSGQGITTSDLGQGRVLIYQISGECQFKGEPISNAPKALHSSVGLLWRNRIPVELDIIAPESQASPVKILEEFSVRKDRLLAEVGPTDDEERLREVLRTEQHGFERVTAVSLPIEIWGVTPEAKRYFSRFHSVTLANVGDDPPISGNPAEIVQFKYFAARDFPKTNDGGYSAVPELETVYDKNAFAFVGTRLGYKRWFATPPLMRWPKPTIVSYKGVQFELAQVREVYDPASQTIVRFTRSYMPYPWGNGNVSDMDAKRK
jgi:hypothetical protein